MRMYDVVNVDRVKRYVPSVGEWPGRTQLSRPPPAIVGEDGVESWEVEAILGKKEGLEYPTAVDGVPDKRRRRQLVVRYLVQWLGYGMDDCSLEPASGVASASDLVTDYERRLISEDSSQPSVMLLCLGERDASI